MAFRAHESENENLSRAVSYLTKGLPEKLRGPAKSELIEISDMIGPVVDGYPSWHPIVANQKNPASPAIIPGDGCGYKKLDHTVFFRGGFLTCPYGLEDELIEAVEGLPGHQLYGYRAKRLKTKFYHESAKPVLVTVDWHNRPMERDGTIPIRIAAGLLLEQELPTWSTAHHAETWDTMRNYFLGLPCGSRSSLFVNEKTGQALKKLWQAVIQTGVFGPINVGG